MGSALAGVGALCLIGAALFAWVLAPSGKRLPDNANVTRQLSGTAAVVLNPAALVTGDLSTVLLKDVPVKATRSVKVLATDGDVAQVSDARTLSTATGEVLGTTQTIYAVNRKSLEATTDFPSTWTKVAPHDGLTVSWPIGATEKDYAGWVSDTESTTTLRYVKEEDHGGIGTYLYTAETAATPIKDKQVLAMLPGSLPRGMLASLARVLPIPDALRPQFAQLVPKLPATVPLSYTSKVTSKFWVEPATGVVVDSQRREVRQVAIGPLPAVVPVYDVTTAFTSASVTDAAREASESKDKISMYGTTLPIILLVIGIVALAGGVVMVMRARPSGAGAVPVDVHGATETDQVP